MSDCLKLLLEAVKGCFARNDDIPRFMQDQFSLKPKILSPPLSDFTSDEFLSWEWELNDKKSDGPHPKSC